MKGAKIWVSVLSVMLILTAGSAGAQDFSFPYLKVDLVKYEPFPAEAGGYVDLFLKVENAGLAEAGNMECELEPSFPFSLDPGKEARKSIGKLPGFEYALFEYKVRVDSNAVDGDNDLEIRCSSDGLDEGVSIVKTLTVNVESKNPEFAIGLVESVPEDLKAGLEDVKITIELQNVGEGDAKLTTVELQLPEGFVPSTSYSNVYNLGNVEKDSFKEAVFYIDIGDEVKAGTYPGVLEIKYKSGSNDQYLEKILFLDLNVKPSPHFLVEEVRAGTGTGSDSFTGYLVKGNAVVNPSDISQGGSGELRITLNNDGEEEAKSVSVKLFKDSTHPFDFDEIYDFIGNLEPGESSDAVFRFNIDANAVLKKYLLDVEIRYLEGNDVSMETATIPFEIAKEDSGVAMFFIPVIVIVVVVAGFFIWRKRKQ